MHRSRYSTHHSAESSYARRDDGFLRDYGGREESSSTFDLFYKFRSFKPYLQKRFNKIVVEGRERELSEEVDDIKYYLSVMNDMLADENHSSETLQSFIDRVHEMIRKNPLNDSYSSTHSGPEDEDEDEDNQRPPESPSPPTIIESDAVPAPPRTIPHDRETLGSASNSYFAYMEESAVQQAKTGFKEREWGTGNHEDTSFDRRNTFLDVDMRASESLYNLISNNTAHATVERGSGVASSSRWENPTSRHSYERSASSRDESFRDRDERYAREYDSNYFGSKEPRYSSRTREESWSESPGWKSPNVGRGGTVREDSYESRPRSRNYSSKRDQESYDYHEREREYERPREKVYERGSDFVREPSYERLRDSPVVQEEPLFERRVQFDRRPDSNQSSSRRTQDGPIQIDYQHGGVGPLESETWSENGADRGNFDKDMRGSISQPGLLFPQNHYNLPPPAQQQLFVEQPNLNGGFGIKPVTIDSYLANNPAAAMLSGAGAMTNIQGMNLGMQNQQSGIGVLGLGIDSNSNRSTQLPPPLLLNHQHIRIQPGLLPTPPSFANPQFGFQNANPHLQGQPRPAHDTYNMSSNDLSRINSNTASSSMMKEISKQKAQQCFARNVVNRKENQNVPPISNVQNHPLNNSTISKPPQDTLLASNQLLSDRDPRLNRLNKKNPTVSSHNTVSHQQPQSTAKRSGPLESGNKADDSKRVDPVADPRLANKYRDPNRSRLDSLSARPNSSRDEKRDRSSTSSDNRQSSRSQDENRNGSHDSKRGGRIRDENHSRTSRHDEDDSRSASKQLDEIRDRVREKLPNTRPPKTSKLQEIRKQVEKEGFHALGRKKSNQNFEEALNPVIEAPPTQQKLVKSPEKTKQKDTPRDSSVEDDKHRKREKSKSDESKKDKGNRRRTREMDKVDNSSRRNRKRSSKSSTEQESSSKSSEEPSIVKKATFRIPKIKRPDPPRIPSPELELIINDEPEADDEPDVDDEPEILILEPTHELATPQLEDTVEETGRTTIDSPQVKAVVEESSTSTEPKKEDIIEMFIRQTLGASADDLLQSRRDMIISQVEKLVAQMRDQVQEEPPATSSVQPAETGTEPVPSEASEPKQSDEVESKDQAEAEATTRPSRSVTRKKSCKRRSSLEKLHDALKEMRFDTMLPLGPRRCTRTNEESHDVPVPQPTAESSAVISQPIIVLQKDNLASVLSNLEKDKSKRGQSSSNKQPDSVGSAGVAETDQENRSGSKSEDESTTTAPTGNKRGRKRKRKGSRVKANKKKKGPVTRAQAAVKTAIKHQLKEKVNKSGNEIETSVTSNGMEASASTTPEASKKRGQRGYSKAEGGRVTRSMIGRNSIVTNLGLTKIKLESDYIPPKKEPDEIEDLSMLDEEAPKDDLESNPTILPDLVNLDSLLEYPDEDLEDDRMSIDIKPDVEDQNLETEHNSQLENEDSNLVSADSPPVQNETEVMEVEDPTDYKTDLSFLPDLPSIDCTFSVGSAALDRCSLDSFLSKFKSEPLDDLPETEFLRKSDDSEEYKDCEELLNWIVSTVEHQADEGIKKVFCSQINVLSDQEIGKLSSATDSIDPHSLSEGEDSVELNEFYYIDDTDSDELVTDDEIMANVSASEETTTKETKSRSWEGEIDSYNEHPTKLDTISRNNRQSLMLTQPENPCVPSERTIHPELQRIHRAGEAYDMHAVLQGALQTSSMSVPSVNEGDDNMDENDPQVKPSYQGFRKHPLKSKKCYEEMMEPEKLCNFFKCMGTYCSYTGTVDHQFEEHLNSHFELENIESEFEGMSKSPDCCRFLDYNSSKLLKDWRNCAYCSLQFNFPVDLKNHIVEQHGQSGFQCGYCFYRGFCTGYVVHHSKAKHPNQPITIYKCPTIRLSSDFVEPRPMNVFCYKCAMPSCRSDRSKRFIFRDEFLNHLRECRPDADTHPCHICSTETHTEMFSTDKLIQHYETHSLFKFHCCYCAFASEDEEDVESHFYEVHPNNSQKIFSRVNVSKSQIAISTTEDKPVEDSKSSITSTSLCMNTGGEPCTTDEKMEFLTENSSSSILVPESVISSDLEDECSSNEERKVKNLEGRELYKCAYSPCSFTALDPTSFKDHIIACPHSSDTKQLSCFHCDKRVKAFQNLLEHIKVHGRKKQMCSLCPFKTWAISEITRHMKTTHKVYNIKADRIGKEEDEDPDMLYLPKEVASRLITLNALKENFVRYADRLIFGPDDLEKIPTIPIFQSQAYCSMCAYSSKVRTNLIRHINSHQGDCTPDHKSVPASDPVNPVPCLERKELMFDKMTNWAGSTHAHKPSPSSSDSAAVPQFVIDQFRYVCSVKGCGQITTDEFMLKTHMRALHSSQELYHCPHCRKDEATKMDARNSVPVDKLGNHLKLHGPRLYRCAYCDFISVQSTAMEKHLPEKHPEKKPIHYLIRNLDANGQLPNRRGSVEDEAATIDKWRCCICGSKSLFPTYDDAKDHCQNAHSVLGQFVCLYCRFCTNSDTQMKHHVAQNCPERGSLEEQIMVMWTRTETTDAIKADDVLRHGPIWKRSSQNVKHIRGIFLEDCKEKGWKADSSPNSKQSILSGQGQKVSNERATKTTNLGASKKLAKLKESIGKQKDPSESVQSKEKPNVPGSFSPSKPVLYFTCPKCNKYKTKNRRDMTVHLYNELHYQRYGCSQCSLKFVTENSLKGHYNGDHGLSYDSSSCDLQPVDEEAEAFIKEYFVQQDALQKSFEESERKGLEKHFSCKHCGHLVLSYHNLKTHILAKHLAADRYKCNYCGSGFWSENLARSHITRIHVNVNEPISIDADEDLDTKITPEFWWKEYGIPTKKQQKLLTKLGNNRRKEEIAANKEHYGCMHCNFTTPDAVTMDEHNQEYHSGDFVVSPEEPEEREPDSPKYSLDFLDELLGPEFSDNLGPISQANRKENSNLYQCYHCAEKCFTVRGVRGHWQRLHSKTPRERCIYYEYKAFNESLELPPGLELCCQYCAYNVSSMASMRLHHQTQHENLIFRMKRHSKTTGKMYVCLHCANESAKLEDFEEHNAYFHPGMKQDFNVVNLRDIRTQSEFVGKLIEDAVKCLCTDCSQAFPTRLEFEEHSGNFHPGSKKEPTMKYNRGVLNSNVKVPTNYPSDISKNTKYQCPVCDYTSDDRQKLIRDHLYEHIHSYSCITCDASFKAYVDAQFHIRHSHALPTATPQISHTMFEAREELERQVQIIKVNGSAQTVNARQLKPKSPLKRKPFISVSEPAQKNSDDDDDVIIDNIIMIKPLSSSLSNGEGLVSSSNPCNRRPDNVDLVVSGRHSYNVVYTPEKPAKKSSGDNPWSIFDDIQDLGDPKTQLAKDGREIIELPNDTDWDLQDFAVIGDGDEFINSSAFSWPEME